MATFDYNYTGIKNIIFDLGAVIIEIDFDLTTQAFADLSGKTFEESNQIIKELDIYDKYEKGELTDAGFREAMREGYEIPNATDTEIDKAWSALLKELPKERVELIHQLNKRYNTFLLSNTSNIHILGVNEILKKSTGLAKINDVCQTTYLSYEMGLRKPGTAIYDEVLHQQNLKAEETLFLDDNADNIEGANQVGIHTIWVEPSKTILEYLAKA